MKDKESRRREVEIEEGNQGWEGMRERRLKRGVTFSYPLFLININILR